ncbi:MAG TPA: U32 family peptidase [bacterium]|nr:U32 family peptidase [bacterium]
MTGPLKEARRPKKPELVAPAGDSEKLRYALHYGADAVYLSDRDLGMRQRAGNLSHEEIAMAVAYAHERGRKVYAAANIFFRNGHVARLEDYFRFLEKAGVDAVIVSDAAALQVIRAGKIGIPVHLSTVANVTNWAAAEFWQSQGVSRIILAREASLEDIREIRRRVSCEIEAFVHGAMCMSYSGRCLISSYLSGRSANRGDCAQPCRWEYELVEEKRPGMAIPVEEDARGSYIMSAKDLCMVDHIGALADAGVDALKIEGRIKSVYYVGNVTRVYRDALDRACGKSSHADAVRYREELASVPNRGYSTGFYFGTPGPEAALYGATGDDGGCRFIGTVESAAGGTATVSLRNPLARGDRVEFISPDLLRDHAEEILEIVDPDGMPVQKAQSGKTVTVRIAGKTAEREIIRMRISARPH